MKGPLMRILSTGGVVELEVDPQEQRSAVGEHWNAIQNVLAGNSHATDDFRGMRIAGIELEANPYVISRWAHEHDVEFEDIYAS